MRRFIPTLLVLAILTTAAPAFADHAKVQALYKKSCQACHGADGEGATPMGKKVGARAMSSPEVAKHTDAELIEITAKGKDKMPAYEKKLSADEIKALVEYMRELGKKQKKS